MPQMFDTQYAGGVDWPYDIRADAEELYNKWARKDFQTDMLRGIVLKGTRDAAGNLYHSDRLDTRFQPKLSFRAFGNNNLLNGQWWPYQICTLRDGSVLKPGSDDYVLRFICRAHGSSQGGISGLKDSGAYSCIMSGGMAQDGKPYPDEDRGDWVRNSWLGASAISKTIADHSARPFLGTLLWHRQRPWQGRKGR